jgi:hypothetical protein
MDRHSRGWRDGGRIRRLQIERLERRELLAANFAEFVDPNPSPGNGFGTHVVPLVTGNVVVTAPGDDAGGIDAGAAYLFNGATGALISTLRGSSADDFVGSDGITTLATGNYLIGSEQWNGFRGALTWASGTTGISGVVNASNSLVGGSVATLAGGPFSITTLANGNYVVISGSRFASVGAATWGSGNTGVSGEISASNSLIGSTPGDRESSTVIELASGNYLVNTPGWDNGSAVDAGAITWGSGTSGVSGLISSTISLVGSTAGDFLGFINTFNPSESFTELANGNFLVHSPRWDNGSAVDAGALTWGSGTTGVSGVVSEWNSLVDCSTPSLGGPFIRVTSLTNGNYLVRNPDWDNGAVTDAGAVTWGSGTSGVTGVVGASNSLVGSTTDDHIGDQITELSNGNYLVVSSRWNGRRGAVTWGSGTSGVSGVLSAANSLVGSTTDDHVGSAPINSITELANGNFVVSSPFWDNGAATDAGAVTWGSGTTGVSGVISETNSLVGTTAFDMLGQSNFFFSGPGVMALANGNYVVSSPVWDNGAATDAGAVTWGSGTSGVSGVVSASNSLVSNSSNDFLGGVGNLGVTALTNGNYVINSLTWNGTGAVTWANGETGIAGLVSASNSLVGIGGDGSQRPTIVVLADGDYVVNNPYWDSDTDNDVGAVTWGSGTSGVSGVVSASNSLVGSLGGSWVGLGGITALANGNYVVSSPYWGSYTMGFEVGAVTWGDGTTGVSGVVSASNSLVQTGGAVHGGHNLTLVELSNGNFVVLSPNRHNGAVANAGAVTWGSGTSGVTGVVSATNSLLGSTTGNRVGESGITQLANGNYLVLSPSWSTGRGAVTWASGTSGVSGEISASNSLVGNTAVDRVGATFNGGGITTLANGNYLVRSPEWDNSTATNAGAVTWGSGTSGVAGTVSALNSLVGNATNDVVGSAGVIELANGNYLVRSPNWDNGAATNAGAVTWANGTSGVFGEISTANSLVGSTANDSIGSVGVIDLPSGNYVISSAAWDNEDATDAGAVTWGNGASGVVGPINALNSAVGVTSTSTTSLVVDIVNDTIVAKISSRILVGSQTVGFTAVRAGSTEWTADFIELVDPVLRLGYIIPPDAAPLPWTNLDRLAVTFTNAIEKAGGGTLTADDFELRGVNQADYNALVTGFSYDAATRTATFTFSQPIEADRLLVHIEGSDVQDAAGHVQLGQFDFRFDVLSGDYTRNGVVDAADYVVWRKQQTSNGALPFSSADANGDGAVDDADYGLWRANFGNTLPQSEVSASSGMAAAADDSVSGRRSIDIPLPLEDGELAREAIPLRGRRSFGPRPVKLVAVGATPHDEGLAAWLVDRGALRFADNSDRMPTLREKPADSPHALDDRVTFDAFFAELTQPLLEVEWRAVSIR